MKEIRGIESEPERKIASDLMLSRLARLGIKFLQTWNRVPLGITFLAMGRDFGYAEGVRDTLESLQQAQNARLVGVLNDERLFGEREAVKNINGGEQING